MGRLEGKKSEGKKSEGKERNGTLLAAPAQSLSAVEAGAQSPVRRHNRQLSTNVSS